MDDTELIRRFKAALAYAGFSVAELAAHARVRQEGGLSQSTLYDVQQGRRPRSPLLSPGELRAIAEACGVPAWFMEHGFLPADTSDPAEYERLSEIERQLMEIRLAVEGLTGADPTREQVSATRSVAGALKDRAVGDESESPAAADTHGEADANPGDARLPREARR